MSPTISDTQDARAELAQRYRAVRSRTESLCEPLEREDMVVQTMPDVSPTKWHLAHTTWFFETLALERSGATYAPFDERYPGLFNSYYRSLGDPYPRAQRGLLSRPTVPEVFAYRRHVDAAIAALLEDGPDEVVAAAAPTITVGLHHEQQHQELLLMDVKNVLARNPLQPTYREAPRRRVTPSLSMEWIPLEGGRVKVGRSEDGFSYDNERPRHAVHLEPFQLASRPVTVGEYRDFMDDGGYERSELWLADGWDLARREDWRAPLYWQPDGDGWRMMTLNGLRDCDPTEPVCHVSYYEADAYATWTQCRLPSELEWEFAAGSQAVEGNLLEAESFHPRPASVPPSKGSLAQLFGDVWEWTSSSYAPYPGYEPFAGELGEYNGKFMINQLVLRGGCCVTPRSHLRATYRNFYYPGQRWMFAGFRLAR